MKVNNLLALITLFFLIQTRLIPHPPNFTPIIAVGIIAGLYSKNFNYSYFLIIISMFFGDLFLGFHKTMLFTYGALAIPVLMGTRSVKFNNSNLFLMGTISSVAFYIITNAGVWVYSGIYDQNINGLILCFVLALPFFGNTILSTILTLVVFKMAIFIIQKKKIIFKKMKLKNFQ